MQVLLSTWGSRGDVEPLVGLAERLLARGARVRLCVPPDEELVARATESGAQVTPLGPAGKELVRREPRPSLPETAARLVNEQVERLPALLQGCDAVVVTGALPAAAGALSVAEAVAVPAASVTFQQLTIPGPDRRPLDYRGAALPAGEHDPRVLWRLDAEAIDELFGEAVNGGRAALGLKPLAHVRDIVVGQRPWLASDPVLDPWRADWGIDAVQTGAWIVPDTTPLPEDLIAFLDDGPPPVYLGFGSMPMLAARDVAAVALAAVRAHGRRAVILRGWAELDGEERAEDHLVVGDVNHQALFPRVAAVVHHGGAGTTTTAARAGAAQVVVPQAVDQPYWARRVAALGVGVAHPGAIPTVASLTAALGTALDPALRARATQVAGLVRADGTTVAAVEVERLAGVR